MLVVVVDGSNVVDAAAVNGGGALVDVAVVVSNGSKLLWC